MDIYRKKADVYIVTTTYILDITKNKNNCMNGYLLDVSFFLPCNYVSSSELERLVTLDVCSLVNPKIYNTAPEICLRSGITTNKK
ncbi:hypothetical protein HHI36_019099 [Cryptolaemus montrouzieri]|uniref:Uncharacterized protein n=1 Tax=Cryptolaemus montrouzieri TaxID=559131 RepID=A0ABD2P2F9_9CUCU